MTAGWLAKLTILRVPVAESRHPQNCMAKKKPGDAAGLF
jgi:hypothetical protein